MKPKKNILILIIIICWQGLFAQDYSKMSRYIRQLTLENNEKTAATAAENTATTTEKTATTAAENTATTTEKGREEGAENVAETTDTISKYVAGAKGFASPTLSEENDCVAAFVKTTDADAVEKYSVASQGDIHICIVPVKELGNLSEDERILRIEATENTATADLDSMATCVNVRPAWQVDRNGNSVSNSDLPQAYTGKDIVVGMVDLGIEYRHPTFRSKTDGHERIVRAWDMLDFTDGEEYNEKKKFPIGKLLTDTTTILNRGLSADSETENHGTHTSGIACGSGWDTNLRGMAPEADIYMVGCIVGTNSSYLPEKLKTINTNTLNTLAFQRIFEYADSVGKPAVINYSISGIQDMTDEDALMNEYLEKLTSVPGHIICASIGNNGGKKCYKQKTSETTTVGGLVNTSENLFILNISTEGSLKMRITDYSMAETEKRSKEITLNAKKRGKSEQKWGDYTKYCEEDVMDSLSVYVYAKDDGFDTSRTGYDIFIYKGRKKFSEGKYVIEIEGEGIAAEVFCQNGQMVSGTAYSPTLTGFEAGGNCGSPGALPSVIGVGGTDHRTAGILGKRMIMSSQGPSLHLYTKPDVTAPGQYIISAYNSLYQSNNPKAKSVKQWSNYGDKQYPWTWMNGTSMSTPCVTGIIALWLEADPTLTKERIKEVIEATSRHPDTTLSYPNNEYGYGEIDGYKGLLYILGIDAIEGLEAEPLRGAAVKIISGGIRVISEGASTLPCRIYTTGGQMVKNTTVNGTKDISLPQGVYAVQVGRQGSTLVRVR